MGSLFLFPKFGWRTVRVEWVSGVLWVGRICCLGVGRVLGAVWYAAKW